jgi:hypothetical protein
MRSRSCSQGCLDSQTARLHTFAGIALWEEGRSLLRPYGGWPCRYETDI